MKRLFLVDDSEFMRSMMREILLKQNYEIVGEADDAKKAIKGVKDTSPDIVLLDVRLNESSGFEVLENIKNNMGNVKVIMCSAMNQKEVINEALIKGADSYITKPFSFKHLFFLLSNA